MAPHSLQAFVAQLSRMPELQRQVAESRSPDQILAIAEQHGFSFTLDELRQASRALAADHWPWGGRGTQVRRAFFDAAAVEAAVDPPR